MTRRSERDDAAETVGRLFDRFGDGLYRYAVLILADRDAAAAQPPRRRGMDWLLPLGAAAAIVVFSVLASEQRRQATVDPSTTDRAERSLETLMTDELSGDALLARHIVTVEFVEDAHVE